MNPTPQDEDPFAGLGGGQPLRSRPQQSAGDVLRKVIAGLALVLGAAMVIVGAALRLDDVRESLGLPPILAGGLIVGGFAVCGLAFALYDRRGPFAHFRKRPPQEPGPEQDGRR